MSEEEGFLARWSRRKREVEAHAASESAKPERPDDEAQPEPSRQLSDLAAPPPGESRVPAGVDLSALPPIESITSATDIRAFLAPGVPAELMRAALRRAWSADPAIRDFVGIAENQWDFTAPGGAPGFGPMESTEEIRRLVSQIVGGQSTEEETLPQAPTPARGAEPHSHFHDRATGTVPRASPSVPSTGDDAPLQNVASADSSEGSSPDAAAQQNSDLPNSPRVRKGGALPR